MKKLGKPVAIIIAFVILVFSALSVFGYSYYTGDNKHTVFKGFGGFDWGIDASGGTKIALKPASEDEAYAIADVIEKRAAKYGLSDYQLYVDNNTSDVIFVVPKSVDSDFASFDVISYLTSYGEFTVRAGDSYKNLIVDSSGGAVFSDPDGDTKNTILFNSRYVKSANTYEYTESGNTNYYIEVQFNDEGTDILAEITNADTGTYYNQTISIWLDDLMLATPTITESFEQGSFSFSSEHMTADKTELIAAIISSGTMPCALSVVGYGDIPPVLGKGVTEVVFWAGIAALLVIAFTLIYKYGAVGFVSTLVSVMQFTSLVAILTGFVGDGHTFMMTIPSAAALALSVMLTVYSCTLIASKVKTEVLKGTVIEASVTEGIRCAKAKILDTSVVLAIVSLVGMFVFGVSDVAISLMGYSIAPDISGFCYVLFLGSVLNVINGYLLPILMLRSVISFKVFAKPSMFGGNK